MGFVPRSQWKGLGLTSCINFMKRSINFEKFEFRAKFPPNLNGHDFKGKNAQNGLIPLYA
jgi:hypothetical protein